METQGPRHVPSGPSLLKTLVESGGVRRRWGIWLGGLSLAAGFALVSLASGNFLLINSSPRSAVKSAVTAAKSAAVKRAERTTSSVADRPSDPSGSLSGGAASSCTELSAIELSFHPTPIAEGNVIWFHSAMSVNGLGSDPATIFLTDATISFTANGTSYNLPVADTRITFDPSAAEATTSFDAASNRFTTVVPSGLSGRAFASGLAFPVPEGGLPEDIGAVAWSASVSTDTPGVSAEWQWAAAVYTDFSSDYNALGIKPLDRSPASQGASLRSKADDGAAGRGMDSVGQPTGLEAVVTGGARGEAGTDFTGAFGAASLGTPCSRMATDGTGHTP